MELIMVNSQKLKIILSPDDMKQFDITSDSLDYSSPKTKKAIGQILEKAKTETGFDTGDDRLYIQVFPSFDGGCEMFLTRKGRMLPEPLESKSTYLKKRYRQSADTKNDSRRYIVKSQSIDNIIELCIRMKKEGFDGTSSLYFHNDEYYLTVIFKKKLPCFVQCADTSEESASFSFMSDYGDIYYADDIPLAYIIEHAKAITDGNAVGILSENFGE